MRFHYIIGIVVAFIVFGALMAMRSESDTIWVRFFISAVAGGVIGLMLLWTQRVRN